MSINQSTAALSGSLFARTPAKSRDSLPVRIGQGLQRYFRVRREYRQLLESPNCMLDDVGLTRQQVRDSMRSHRFELFSGRTLSR